jgi:hypothetical protein
MGALAVIQHEEFCQCVRNHLVAGKKRGEAWTAAYREIILKPGIVSSDATISANARRLVHQKLIKARLAEIAENAAKIADLDAAWALRELKADAEALKTFNLDDYLGPPDEMGNRYYDLSKAPREHIALLTEYTIESSYVPGAHKDDPGRKITKVRLKGPDKIPERRQIIALMARIAGWEAPTRAEVNTRDLTLEALVMASLAPPPAEATKLVDQSVV